MLILGDSTAVGTGASHPAKSLAGLFAAADSAIAIRVVAKNGLFISDLPALMTPVIGQRFSLVIIIIGGNDVLQFTSIKRMTEGLERIMVLAGPLSNHLVLVHQGNLGAMPLFPRWFAPRLTARSRQWREIMRTAALRHRALMVDLFQETADHPWDRDPVRFYGGDWFHPNDAGYAMWFNRIQTAWRNKRWDSV